MKRRQKLQKDPTGPYRVIRANEHNVGVQTGDKTETVARQRVIKAPEPFRLSSMSSEKSVQNLNSALQNHAESHEPTEEEQSRQEFGKVVLRRSPRKRRRESSRIWNRRGKQAEVAPQHEDTVEAVMDKIL